MYSIGGEEQYIFNVLNTTTPVIKEYERLTKDMGIDLIDVANNSFDRFLMNEQERKTFPTSLFDEYEEWQ